MVELHHFPTDLLLLPGLWFLFRVGLGILLGTYLPKRAGPTVQHSLLTCTAGFRVYIARAPNSCPFHPQIGILVLFDLALRDERHGGI